MPSNLHCQYSKGTHTRNERADILKGFSDTEYGWLSNARCLTEGVNIPSVDCVAFLSPKRSKVYIIQVIGRAMRKDPKNPVKKIGYVLLREPSKPLWLIFLWEIENYLRKEVDSTHKCNSLLMTHDSTRVMWSNIQQKLHLWAESTFAMSVFTNSS